MTKSAQLHHAAEKFIPAGVNSPVRAFKGVGGHPIYFSRGKGAYLYDVDDNRYIDYVSSWGPMIVGHANDKVLSAVSQQLQKGLGFGAPTEIETQLAEKVCQLVPSIDLVRMVNSGTEATMSAIRLARGYTKRDKIVKFEGCYHGHVDSLLVKAGSGALTLGVPTSPGIPAALAEQTITLNFNDSAQVKTVFQEQGHEIAAIIVEPVAGNMNCVPPDADFLPTLRAVCDEYHSVLIFDEVMTGFRVALGGAAELYQVTPDLTTLGKILGGGLPVGAFGGKDEIMQHIAPLGPVYQAGTLSGNPLAMAAGLATLNLVEQPGFHANLSQLGKQLTTGIVALSEKTGIAIRCNQVGAMFGIFFSDAEKISTFQQVMACDVNFFKSFYHRLLDAGIYMAPSAFEAGFISAAHTPEDITYTLQAFERSLIK